MAVEKQYLNAYEYKKELKKAMRKQKDTQKYSFEFEGKQVCKSKTKK